MRELSFDKAIVGAGGMATGFPLHYTIFVLVPKDNEKKTWLVLCVRLSNCTGAECRGSVIASALVSSEVFVK